MAASDWKLRGPQPEFTRWNPTLLVRNELHGVREHVAVSLAADGDVASLARRKFESAKQVPFSGIVSKVNQDCLTIDTCSARRG